MEDNDNLVYGACCVIRMCAILIHLIKILTILFRSNIKEASDQVTIFNSKSIETNPLVSLSHESLFFMAILCGGDYDKVSLMKTVSSDLC